MANMKIEKIRTSTGFFKENVRCPIWTCRDPKNMYLEVFCKKKKCCVAVIVSLAVYIVRIEFVSIASLKSISGTSMSGPLMQLSQTPIWEPPLYHVDIISLILGTVFSFLGTQIRSLQRLKKP